MLRRRSIISVANEQVSILSVLRWVAVDVPEDVGVGRSRKLRCPFGELYHSDQGAAAAMRVYPDGNCAWCFSCTTRYTPVSLAAQAWDLDPQDAAVTLLDRIGYKPVDLAQAWADVLDYRPPPDRAMLAEALKVYCRRICPTWAVLQFEPEVAAALSRCLSLLDLVSNDEAAWLWIDGCSRKMHTTLGSASLYRKSDESAILGAADQ